MTSSRFNPLITIEGGNADDQLGFSVDSAGDVNNDGYADVIVGAPFADPGGRTSAGEVYVIYGSREIDNLDLGTILPPERGFTIFGNASNDQLGRSVASAGDVNNDGYADVIVGAPFADPGGRSNAGEAYVIYGNATLSNIDLSVTDTTSAHYFSSSRGFSILGRSSNDQLGYSVASAGDVDNDGYDDVIAGAFRADPGGRLTAGEAYIIYGNTTLSNIDLAETDTAATTYFSSSKGFSVLGNRATDQLGVSVSGAGDINNDDYNDIVIGANTANFGTGEAYVVYGNTTLSDIDLSETDTTSATYFSSDKGFRVIGESDTELGVSVSEAGDVNNDGFDDVIIGTTFGGQNSEGAAYIIYGNTTLSTINLRETDRNSPSYFGSDRGFSVVGNSVGSQLGISVNSEGDLNNDGYADVIVGAHLAAPGGRSNAGEAYVIYGNATLSNIDLSETDTTSATYFSSSRGFSILGESSNDELGMSVGGVGDIDNDGFNDIIIGASTADPGGRSDAGEAHIIRGAVLVATDDATISQDLTNQDIISRNVRVDNSLSDLTMNDAGVVSYENDLDLNRLANLNITNSTVEVYGYGDILYTSNSQRIFDLSQNFTSQDLGLSTTVIYCRDSSFIVSDGDFFSPHSLMIQNNNCTLPARNVDLDIDLSITDSNAYNYFNLGRGFKVLGGADVDLLGSTVNGLGDINGDGYSDMMIGALEAAPGGRTSAGEVYVIYGNTTLSDIDLSVTDTNSPSYFSNSKGFRILGGASGDFLRTSVNGQGDINGDNYSDIIIGASSADPGGRDRAGEAYVIYGNATLSDIDLSVTDTNSPSYFSNSKGFRVLGGANGDNLGRTVGIAGDINNDGIDDMIVGAWSADPGGRNNAGEVYIVYGNETLSNIDLAETDPNSPSYFSNSRGFRVSGEASGDRLGNAVSKAGDVNRDGYSDVIVGALSADPGGRSNAGEGYVIYGNATLSDIDLAETDTTATTYFSSSKGFRISGEAVGDSFGISAGGAGDVNRDGYNDVTIGAWTADPGGR